MYWTELWVAILTAALAFALWVIWCHDKFLAEIRQDLVGKQDKRPFAPKPRARRVKPTKPLHDYASGEVIGHECPECGARVAEMGHTVAACEDWQTELAKRSNTKTT